MIWDADALIGCVYVCHTPPSSTIFLWISCGDCQPKTHWRHQFQRAAELLKEYPEIFVIIDHLGSPLMEDLMENAEQNLSFCSSLISSFWFRVFFGHVMSCHVMSTESWCKVEEGIQVPLQGIIKHQQTAGFWEASFSRTGRRTSSKSVQCTGKTWKSPVPRIFFLHLRHVYRCACQHSLVVFSFKVTLLYLKQWRYWKGLEKLAALPQTFMKISMCLDKFFRVESVDVPWKSYQM